MSDAESRILPWPGPMGPPLPGRPPMGGWPRPPWPPGPVVPPGPGPFPQPPDVFSAFAWLAKNYQESQAAKAFLRLLITDLIAEDPAFLANAHATVGITDGSTAQPGMVGEFLHLEGTFSYPAATTATTVVSLGALPPGDWDMWSLASFSTPQDTVSVALTPPIAGAALSWGTLSKEGLSFHGAHSTTSMSAPALVAFTIVVNQATATAGTGSLSFRARRVR